MRRLSHRLAGVIRRLARLGVAALAIASAVICLLWVRSYWVGDELRSAWPRHGPPGHRYRYVEHDYVAHSVVGRVMFRYRYEHDRRPSPKEEQERPIVSWSPTETNWVFPAFGLVTEIEGIRPVYWASYERSTSGQWSSANPSDAQYQVERAVDVPHWLLAVVTGLLPITLATKLLATSLRRQRCGGLACPKCGYDLRATPDKCPECGTVVAATCR